MYAVYGVFVFVLFFMLNWTSRCLDTKILNYISTRTKYSVEIEDSDSSVFPPTVHFFGVHIYDPENKNINIDLKKVDFSLSLLNLLVSKIGVNFNADCYGGNIQGDVSTGFLFNTKSIELDLEGKALDIGGIPQLRNFDQNISGHCDITIEANGSPDDVSSVEGALVLKGNDLVISGIPPLFKAPVVKIDSFALVFDFVKLKAQIKKADLDGKDLSGSLQGKIVVSLDNFMNSVLDLKGEVLADIKLFNQKAIVQKNALALLKAGKPIKVEISQTLANPWIIMPD